MSYGQTKNAKELFEQVADLPAPERLARLRELAGDNLALIAEVLELCAGDDAGRQRGFGQTGAGGVKFTANRGAKMIGREIRGYKIIREIKGGGMSEVYQAERVDGMFKRQVVIKIFGAHLSQGELPRFKGECQALELIKHTNVAQLYDAGWLEEDGRPFMIVEYVEGEMLRKLLVAPSPQQPGQWFSVALPVPQALAIALQACAGLGAAHKSQLVHRDIKPENIMIAGRGAELLVKIIDFGLAQPQASGILPSHKPTVGVIGTAEYMSPEQISPEEFLGDQYAKPGPASDIYALGVVVYEMLTGRRPFSGEGYNVVRKHLSTPPPSLRTVRPEIPPELDAAVLKALAKRPAERHSSMEAFAAAMQRAVDLNAERPTTNENLIEKTTPVIAPTSVVVPSFLTPDDKDKKGQSLARRAVVFGLPVVLAAAALGYFQPWKQQPDVIPPTPTPVVSPSPAITPSPAPVSPTASLSLGLFRQDKNKQEQPATADTVFHSGEGMRLTLTPSAAGHLVILQKNGAGVVSQLFPHPLMYNGRHQLAASQNLSIPPLNKGWLRFDQTTGTETLYVIFAPQSDDPLLMQVSQAPREKAGRLTGAAAAALEAELEKRGVEVRGSLSGQGTLVGWLRLRHDP